MASSVLRNLIKTGQIEQQDILKLASVIALEEHSTSINSRHVTSDIKEANYGADQERVDKLQDKALLVDILSLIEDTLSTSSSSSALPQEFCTFLEDVCLQILSQPYNVTKRRGSKNLASLECHLICCQIAALVLSLEGDGQNETFSQTVKESILFLLNHYLEEAKFVKSNVTVSEEELETSQSKLSIESALLVAAKYVDLSRSAEFPKILDSSWYQELKSLAISILPYADPHVCTLLCEILLPQNLFEYSTSEANKQLSFLWTALVEVFIGHKEKKYRDVTNIYLVLCVLADRMLPLQLDLIYSDTFPKIWENAMFWQMLQEGLLHHRDTLARKRSNYLLRRTIEILKEMRRPLTVILLKKGSDEGGARADGMRKIFSWNVDKEEELLQTWNIFYDLYEALGEVQIHIIQPVLPKIKRLIEACKLDETGSYLLHTSWVTVLLQRGLQHESKTIPRWGLETCLGLDLSQIPLVSQNGAKFILGPVLNILKEEFIYMRGGGQKFGECPYMVSLLQSFIENVVAQLDPVQRKEFLQDFLSFLCNTSWGPVPLPMLIQVLGRLSPFPAWGSKQLHDLRQLLSYSIHMLPIIIRDSIQLFTVKATLNLVDCQDISFKQLMSFLSVVGVSGVFYRGGQLWSQVCDWLSHQGSSLLLNQSMWLQEEVTQQLKSDITDGDYRLLSNDRLKQLTSMILMFYDVTLNMQKNGNEQSAAGDTLCAVLLPLKDVLCCVGSHVYMSESKANRSLQVITSLLEEIISKDFPSEVESFHIMKEILLASAQEIFEYISRKLFDEDQEKAFGLQETVLYLDTISSMIKFSSQCPETYGHLLPSSTLKFCGNLERKCLSALESLDENMLDKSLHCVTQVQILSWLFQQDSVPLQFSSATLLCKLLSYKIPSSKLRSSHGSEDRSGYSSEEIGRFISHVIRCKWHCINHLLRSDLKVNGVDMVEALQTLIDDISITSGCQSTSLIEAASLIMTKVAEKSPSLCCEFIDAAWSSIMDQWQHHKFMEMLDLFVKMAFQVELMCFNETTLIFSSLTKYAELIMEHGDQKPGFTIILSRQLSRDWLSRLHDASTRKEVLLAARTYMNLLIKLCLYGTPSQKGLRLLQETLTYFTSVPSLSPIKEKLQSSSADKDPSIARVAMVNLIISIGLEGSHDSKHFLGDLLQAMIVKDMEVGPKRKCYMINSTVHRQKQRIWQTALVILPFTNEDTAMSVCHQLLRCLAAENQSSAKHLMEWLIVRLVHQFPELLTFIWDSFDEVVANFRGSVSPVLMILSHIGSIQQGQKKNNFYKRVIPLLFPWTLASSVSLRIQSQVSLYRIWLDCKRNNNQEVLDTFPALDACMKPNQAVGTILATRLEGNFFFGDFDPVADYSIETIFETLPYLTLVVEEEQVAPHLFQFECPELWAKTSQLPLPLFNSRDALRNSHKLGKKKEYAQDTTDFRDNDRSDFQKKIMPLRDSLVPQIGKIPNSSSAEKKRGKLVVVASLIDKMPNLGGICRTSEIFGVSTVVFASYRHLEDDMFKSLSVSSQKWLECIEVKSTELKEYLLEMRHQGYTLIGVEQTANSRSLKDFQFPEKTVLILGNERTGIPVEMIQSLDVCVEIPQVGHIRSLNVHVSASLLIWEYTRQQLL